MNSKVVVNAWVADLTFPGYMDWWHKCAEEFNAKHPGYQVNIRALGFFEGPKEIADGIAEGQNPAIAEYYFYMAPAARDTQAPDGSPAFTSLEQAVTTSEASRIGEALAFS